MPPHHKAVKRWWQSDLMRKLLIYLLLALAKPTLGQMVYLTHRIDSLTLKDIVFTKPILYQYGSVH